jgi:hypothetical protein
LSHLTPEREAWKALGTGKENVGPRFSPAAKEAAVKDGPTKAAVDIFGWAWKALGMGKENVGPGFSPAAKEAAVKDGPTRPAVDILGGNDTTKALGITVK